MTLSSMTGFGEGAAERDGWRVTVTARSVNHKQLDVRFATPEALGAWEPAAAKRVRARFARGRFDVRVRTERVATAASTVSWDAADAAHARLVAVAERYGVAGPTLPELVRAGALEGFERGDTTALPAVADDALAAAIDALAAFRTREGEALATWFADELGRFEQHLDRIAARAEAWLPEHAARLETRARELLGRLGADDAIDHGRLASEVALLAERADITEEQTRAAEHVRALRTLLAEGDGRVGKTVDFLLQELIRETNTMASKSADAALTHAVVDAKASIEQMREQAMNLE